MTSEITRWLNSFLFPFRSFLKNNITSFASSPSSSFFSYPSQVQFIFGTFIKLNWRDWREMMTDALRCRIVSCQPYSCPDIPSPNLAIFLSMPLAILTEGIVLCSWAFSRDTWRSWQEVSRQGSRRLLRNFSSSSFWRKSSSSISSPSRQGSQRSLHNSVSKKSLDFFTRLLTGTWRLHLHFFFYSSPDSSHTL